MAIYSIHEERVKQEEEKTSLFSALAARLFFFVLLLATLAWGVYTTCLLGISCFGLKKLRQRSWLNFKRFLVCTNALFVSLVSPALGVMFACSYFLMYDKAGIDEVVPNVLREQFKGFFQE